LKLALGWLDKVLKFGMLAEEVNDVGALGNDAKIVGAGEFESGAGEFGGETLTFERGRDFGVVEDDGVARTYVGDAREQAAHGGFETVGLFIVEDGDGVEVQVHGEGAN
jgi:hypothetical protein